MKTTIYELLGMIKDGKAPKTLVFKKDFYEYVSGTRDYYCETTEEYLFDSYDILTILNDEVEILETTITYKADKIEKIDIDGYFLSPNGAGKIKFTISEKILADKINELIDYMNNDYIDKINELYGKINECKANMYRGIK